MDTNDQFTRRDAKADTSDIPVVTGADLTDERARRAMSYRERQRQESQRQAQQAAARGERYTENPYINSRRKTGGVSSDGFDILDDFEEEARRSAAYAVSHAVQKKAPAPTPAAPAGKSKKSAKNTKKSRKKKKKKSVAYRVICGILGTLIGLLVVFTGFIVYYISSFDMNTIELDNSSNGMDSQYTQYHEDEDGEEEIRVVDTIYEGTERDSFREAVREWKDLGNAYLQSNRVINVLLVGIDRNEDGSDGRSDTMILASLNLNTKTITLSSFYRDSWMYQTFDNGERTAWAKLNATFVYGGADGLISNIEDYYKIHIDHYVGVDFQSFQDIINAVGGVVVPVQDYEAEFINEQLCYEAVQPGEAVTLTGEEALWFVRMRHTDADGEVSRTRRQRLFISALIDEFKTLSLSEIDDVVSTLFEYVQTDMSKTDIISYGIRALTGQWYNYTIQQQQVPDEAYRWDYNGSTWVWIVDYPGAAYAMQMGIYGYSNIVLDANRYTMIDIAQALDNAGYQVV